MDWLFKGPKKEAQQVEVQQAEPSALQTQQQLRQRRGKQQIDMKTLQQFEQALKTNVENFMLMKLFENKIYMSCIKKCVTYEECEISEKQKNCLAQCNGKIKQYIQIAKQDFMKEETNLKTIGDEYLNSIDTLKKLQSLVQK